MGARPFLVCTSAGNTSTGFAAYRPCFSAFWLPGLKRVSERSETGTGERCLSRQVS